MTLRSKLLASPAPLAVVLVLLGVTSVKTLRSLGQSPELILKDNYRSVLAAERMIDAVSGLQEIALAAAASRERETSADALRRVFEAELSTQEHNITEPGEQEATSRLRELWDQYRSAFDSTRALPPGQRLSGYFDTLQPLAVELRRTIHDILDLNQDAMARKSDQARSAAQRNVDLVVVATLVALFFGLVSTLALTARLLRPLGVLSQTVRRIAQGDLEARARVFGKDEIAALAQEFNAMADRLSEYRRSSLGELLQAQQASQAAIDSLPDPVLVLDAGGAIINLNGAAEEVLRLGSAPQISALEPELREVVDRVRQHVAAGRGPYLPKGFDEAVRVGTPEGYRHLLPRATPLYSEDSGIVGVTIVLQDVTRLMRFDELKNDLVATVAHEFRTPLTSLRMAIHLLAEEVVGPLTDKQADLISAARDECERLQGIVDDLLDLSRIQAGRMELRVERLDAGALLTSAFDALRAQADEAGISLQVEEPAAESAVRADPERVALVLSNLLGNAIRHTPRGGEIVLRAREAGGAERFEVSDTGAGIPPEHQERIFDKFYRVPGERGGGVGLGLYISREIVQAHGGDMGVSSVPGKGSTFWFTLPRTEAARTATATR
ncbi:MAG TPA: ATP-binding protein [Anaeromyxobacter sp.]|nr:ATP-binding protein [Anaeromyxobacter sp.]